MLRLRQRIAATAVATVFGITALAAHAPEARADQVDGKGKGIVGGALLGFEVVSIPMSLFGVKAGWAYAVFGGLGAVGGGVAGAGVELATDSYKTPTGDGRAPIYMLAGGLALVIPTVVLMLNATRFQPSEDAREDQAPKNAPSADPGSVNKSVVIGGEGGASTEPKDKDKTTPAPTPAPKDNGGGGGTTPAPNQRPMQLPHSLLDVNDGTFRLGVPVPEVREAYTLRQIRDLGVRQITEVRMPVLSVTF